VSHRNTADPSQVDIGSQNDIPKKRHPSLKLTFKDGVNANRKIPNSGVSTDLSATRVANRDVHSSVFKSFSSLFSFLFSSSCGKRVVFLSSF
jgi:hypothetical protein